MRTRRERAERFCFIGHAHHHLAPVQPRRHDPLHGVGGEPVVQLESETGQSATVHGPEHDLALERPEQRQVIDDVRRAQDAVDARSSQRRQQPAQQFASVRHRHRVGANFEHAARRVIGRDQEQ